MNTLPLLTLDGNLSLVICNFISIYHLPCPIWRVLNKEKYSLACKPERQDHPVSH